MSRARHGSGASRPASAAGSAAGRAARVLAALAWLGLAACSGAGARLAVLEGNADLARGLPQRAVAAYLRAGEGDVQAYDRANAYAALGETAAALAAFEELGDSDDPRVAFASSLNAGLALMAGGRHAEAILALRRALRADPARQDARRALELAVEAERASAARPPAPRSPSAVGEGGDADELLDILRELETGLFRPPNPAPGASAPDDY